MQTIDPNRPPYPGPFRYLDAVSEHPEADAMIVAVASAIARCADNTTGESKAAVEALAAKARMPLRTFKRHQARLRELGFLVTKPRGKGMWIRHLTIPDTIQHRADVAQSQNGTVQDSPGAKSAQCTGPNLPGATGHQRTRDQLPPSDSLSTSEEGPESETPPPAPPSRTTHQPIGSPPKFTMDVAAGMVAQFWADEKQRQGMRAGFTNAGTQPAVKSLLAHLVREAGGDGFPDLPKGAPLEDIGRVACEVARDYLGYFAKIEKPSGSLRHFCQPGTDKTYSIFWNSYEKWKEKGPTRQRSERQAGVDATQELFRRREQVDAEIEAERQAETVGEAAENEANRQAFLRIAKGIGRPVPTGDGETAGRNETPTPAATNGKRRAPRIETQADVDKRRAAERQVLDDERKREAEAAQ